MNTEVNIVFFIFVTRSDEFLDFLLRLLLYREARRSPPTEGGRLLGQLTNLVIDHVEKNARGKMALVVRSINVLLIFSASLQLSLWLFIKLFYHYLQLITQLFHCLYFV